MQLSRSWFTFFTFAQGISSSSCLHIPPNQGDSAILTEYDYIVVGGGASGLVIANRLSEDPDVMVLVLEAGKLDTEGYTVTIPAEIGDDLGSEYDWQLKTVRQEYLYNQQVEINQGKVVGGGTILNGMVWTRGSRKDYDTWDDLNNVQGKLKNYDWRWDNMLPYFRKNENFTMDVDSEIREKYQIRPDDEVHGSKGFVQVSYPHYIYEQSGNFLRGMEELGVPVISEPNNGTGYGAFLAPSSLAADNQSRSDSRVAYANTAVDRPNLHIATQQMVERILFDQVQDDSSHTNNTGAATSYRATGVAFAASAQDVSRNVTCSREVILAAGAIFSPTLLQISGVGPEDELASLGIPVKIDLPGVGSNAQDHGMLHPRYSYTNSSLATADTFLANNETKDAVIGEYYTNRTGPLTAPMISMVAFPALQQVASDWSELLRNASQRDAKEALPAGTHPSVQRGYVAQRQHQLGLLSVATEGAVEILADSVGTLSVAMQRPLSRGTVRPTSQSIFDLPAVDPRYCADSFDCLVLARALLFNCALVQTSAMAELQPVVQDPYFCPNLNEASNRGTHGNATTTGELFSRRRDGVEMTTNTTVNDELLDLVKGNLTTEFHPSGTTAMLPRELGGVVDTDLKVYGTTNLRVVDAGVMPMVLGAHLQAAVYGIAERAADIIKEAAC